MVHPSLAALPTALVHAIASRRRVVASGVGGVPEIVSEDAGVLVPAGDAAALARAAAGIAVDPDRRDWIGKGGRERSDEEFTAGVWAPRLRRLYDSVIP